MCGIFGLAVSKEANYTPARIEKYLARVGRLSEARGKDSSGLLVRDTDRKAAHTFKGPVVLNKLFGWSELQKYLRRAAKNYARENGSSAFCAIGHSRLVTNGTQIRDENNQPIHAGQITGVHNGIIVNDADLWKRHQDLERTADIDTEIMFALIDKRVREGLDLASSTRKTVNDIFGTVSTAFFSLDRNCLILASNNRSLYYLTDDESFLVFASEEHTLRELLKSLPVRTGTGFRIRHMTPGMVSILDLDDFTLCESKDETDCPAPKPAGESWSYEEHSYTDGGPQMELVLDPAVIARRPEAAREQKLLEHHLDRIRALARCSRCLLPETFPFIEYDGNGVCNYCHNYKIKNPPRENPTEELMQLVEPYRRGKGAYDCIVPYSGGRDSTYALHMIKRELGLNPVAFTYDWGMVTDLARRNIARVCGTLGVENIIVSADIRKKRDNIRKNLTAWLKKPHLGMLPLLMAGDKYFFYYTAKVRKQTGIDLNIWGINPLENTDFKVGFMGVPPDFEKKRIYSLSMGRQAKLFGSAAKIILSNPGYLNSSIADTLGGYASRMLATHRDYYHLFDYYRWDENEIEDLVLNEYHWEKAIDTDTTWRIGDGTAAFYNYAYYIIAGFSEYDTFRSNQIREGQLTREEGLKLVEEENRPRYASLRWYLDIVGVDFEDAIRAVNGVAKLYG